MELQKILTDFGVNIGANAVYDFIKSKFTSFQGVDANVFKDDLASLLKIENSNVVAEKIISFLADKGDIEIKGSIIFSRKAIEYSSNKSSKFSLESSSSKTDKTGILVGENASIVGQGGARIRQNSDGSITFHT